MNFSAFTTATPDGDFSVIASDTAVVASGWTDDLSLLTALIHGSFRPEASTITTPSRTAVLDQARAALTAFYDGDSTLLASVPVVQKSGPFREHAWDVLRTVSPGEVITYAQYAQRCNNERAVRAAASACAMNAAALFVPCHRIVRTDGSLGGFRYGLGIKERLLSREHSA